VADISPVRDSTEDVVKAGTFRLTLGTQAAAVIGALITGLNPLFGDDFSDGQKTAIIIAAIAFIAISQVADVLARAWGAAAASSAVAALPKALPVSVRLPAPEDDYDGSALAIRGKDEYLVVPSGVDGKGAAWVAKTTIRFK
jgi:hypothetical protein